MLVGPRAGDTGSVIPCKVADAVLPRFHPTHHSSSRRATYAGTLHTGNGHFATCAGFTPSSSMAKQTQTGLQLSTAIKFEAPGDCTSNMTVTAGHFCRAQNLAGHVEEHCLARSLRSSITSRSMHLACACRIASGPRTTFRFRVLCRDLLRRQHGNPIVCTYVSPLQVR